MSVLLCTTILKLHVYTKVSPVAVVPTLMIALYFRWQQKSRLSVNLPPVPEEKEIFEFMSVTSSSRLLALPPLISSSMRTEMDVVFVDSRNLWMAGFLACERGEGGGRRPRVHSSPFELIEMWPHTYSVISLVNVRPFCCAGTDLLRNNWTF